MNIWNYSKVASWKRSRKSQNKLTTNQVPELHIPAQVASSNLRQSGESRLAQGNDGNTRTLGTGGSPDRRRSGDAKTSDDVGRKRTSLESVLYRLERILTKE
ncbi:hypothetical protein JTB14_004809 [Gonioctena quinquepunctata]|nr:hypothetical protein JTB14_004809 [Gonioctena quinquepunctata]